MRVKMRFTVEPAGKSAERERAATILPLIRRSEISVISNVSLTVSFLPSLANWRKSLLLCGSCHANGCCFSVIRVLHIVLVGNANGGKRPNGERQRKYARALYIRFRWCVNLIRETHGQKREAIRVRKKATRLHRRYAFWLLASLAVPL